MERDLDGRGKEIIGLGFCLPNPGGGARDDCSGYCSDYLLRWSCREVCNHLHLAPIQANSAKNNSGANRSGVRISQGAPDSFGPAAPPQALLLKCDAFLRNNPVLLGFHCQSIISLRQLSAAIRGFAYRRVMAGSQNGQLRLRSRVHAKLAGSTSRGTSFHASCSEFGVLRLSSKGPSHSMATAKFPEALGCTRSTLPRAFSSMPGLGTCATPTANSTVEPAGIRKALDSRMPLRLMFSD